MRHRTLALSLLLMLSLLPSNVKAAPTEIVLIDRLDLALSLGVPGQKTGALLTDNHPSDSGSTSSLGQTFNFSQAIDSLASITLDMARTGVGGNPTVDLVAVISTSDGSTPTTELFRSDPLPASSLARAAEIKLNLVTFFFPESGQTRLEPRTWYSFEIQASATGTINIGNNVAIYEANPDSNELAPGNVFWYSSAGYATLAEDFVYEVRGRLLLSGGGGGGTGSPLSALVDALPTTGPLAGGAIFVLAAVAAGLSYFVRVESD